MSKPNKNKKRERVLFEVHRDSFNAFREFARKHGWTYNYALQKLLRHYPHDKNQE